MKRLTAGLAGLACVTLAACETDEAYQRETLRTAAQMEAANEGDLVCRRVEVTGSKFHREICMTREEADRRAQVARETADRLTRSSDLEPYRGDRPLPPGGVPSPYR